MDCRETREVLSEYLEQSLPDCEAALVQEHLAACAECSAELDDLDATLSVIHSLPRHEPVFDLWQEFAPRMAEIQAEAGLDSRDRVRLSFSHFLTTLKEGWLMFRTVVRYSYTSDGQS